MGEGLCQCVHRTVCGSQDNVVELVLFYFHVGPGGDTQVSRLA